MDCGHHESNRNRSVETGVEFCDACRSAEMLRDALTMEQHYTLTTVTAAWASPSSVILCRSSGEEASVEGLQTTVTSQSAGSFVVRSEPRNGTHWGNLPFACVGN